MEMEFKEHLNEETCKWLEILNNQYADRAERRGDTDASLIDYSKGYLTALTHIRTFLEEQHEKQ